MGGVSRVRVSMTAGERHGRNVAHPDGEQQYSKALRHAAAARTQATLPDF